MEEGRVQAEELDVAGLSLCEATPEQHSMSLDHLPDDAVRHIALFMWDPAPLASACRRTAALLSQDAFLADWAAQHQPARLPVGYGLLHWRRVRNSNPQQMATMLLRQLQKQQNHSTKAQQPSAEHLATAQQLLDAGDAPSALQALLPHSEQLLVLYAAKSYAAAAAAVGGAESAHASTRGVGCGANNNSRSSSSTITNRNEHGLAGDCCPCGCPCRQRTGADAVAHQHDPELPQLSELLL